MHFFTVSVIISIVMVTSSDSTVIQQVARCEHCADLVENHHHLTYTESHQAAATQRLQADKRDASPISYA